MREQIEVETYLQEWTPSHDSWSHVHQIYGNDLGFQDQGTLSFQLQEKLLITDYHLETLSQSATPPLEHDSQTTQRENPKKKLKDYEKNIVPYISKKTVQGFVDRKFKKLVGRLCRAHNCDYQAAVGYYRVQEKEVFGVGLLGLLLTPQNLEEVGIKRAFRAFMRVFLRKRYLVYMMRHGKMQEKQTYLEYKNKYFLYMSEVESSELNFVQPQ